MTIIDTRGKVVTKLVESEQAAGWYDLTWSGMNQQGRPMSTGVYFCRLEVGKSSKTIKMILIK
jgi:flagellar hook assembly protein FlgD